MNSIDFTNLTKGQKALVKEVVSGDSMLQCWTGAVRSGKGVGSALAMVYMAHLNHQQGIGNGIYILGGATSGSFERNNEGYIQEAAEAFGYSFSRSGGSNPHYRIGNEIKFHVFGGNNKRSFQAVRGLTATSGWIDEATLVDRSFFDTVNQRLSFDESKLIMTQNADRPTHWVKTDIIDMNNEGVFLLESLFDENFHYSEKRRRDLLAFNPHTADYRRAIGNMWAEDEGLIIRIPSESLVSTPLSHVGHVFMDPGTSGTTAALLFAKTASGWEVADEYYHVAGRSGSLTDREHLQSLLSRWTIHSITIDPGGGGSNMRTEATRMGLSAFIAKNAFEEGVQVTNNALWKKSLTINKRCLNLLSESQSYVWNTALRAPQIGKADHLMDCLRYGCMNFFPANYSFIFGRR